MVFKNQKELERFIMKQSRQALMKAQDKVYGIIKEFFYQYYTEYKPKQYDRTRRLLESLVKSQIVSDGKGYKAEVYVDLNYLNYIYSIDSQTGVVTMGEDVIEAANRGEHGVEYVAYSGGTEIWDEPIRVLDAKAIDILKDMLISEGIPIK